MLVSEVSSGGELELLKGLEGLTASLGDTRAGALAHRDQHDDRCAGRAHHPIPEPGEGHNHKQTNAECGDQHIAPILREFAVMAAHLAHQNQARAERAVLAEQRDGSSGAHKDSILVGTKQPGEQDEVTACTAKLTPWPRNIQPAFLASRLRS